jgi:hypothetical protein
MCVEVQVIQYLVCLLGVRVSRSCCHLCCRDGGIQGPAIVHFQQTKQGFWEPLVLAIGICEALRVSRGWADPVDKARPPVVLHATSANVKFARKLG